MSSYFVDVEHPCAEGVNSCSVVFLCLKRGWETKTSNGRRVVTARVITVNEYGCHSPKASQCCDDLCLYQLDIPYNQFEIDPDTSLPYCPTSEDIQGITSLSCLVEAIFDSLDAREDWVVDPDNVVKEESPAGLITSQIPIIDRLSGDNQGTLTIEDRFSVLSQDVATSSATFSPPVGDDVVLNFCDLIEGCFDGVTITRNSTTGKYEAVVGSSPTIVSGDSGQILVAGSDGGALLTCPAVHQCMTPVSAIGTSANSETGLAVDISSVGVVCFDAQSSGVLPVANTSGVYDMNICVKHDGFAQFILQEGGVWRFSIEASYDGAPYTTVASREIGSFPAGPVGISEDLDSTFLFIYPPGQIVNVEVRVCVETIVPPTAPGSFVTGVNAGVQYQGVII